MSTTEIFRKVRLNFELNATSRILACPRTPRIWVHWQINHSEIEDTPLRSLL